MIRRVDTRGREITVGAAVAYNLGGMVIRGKVVDIQPSHFKIEADEGHQWYPKPGHVSRVRNERGILVLDAGT